jgi:chromosome segregation ATPase
METRMRQLNEQQEISLATTRGQLDDARNALKASGERIAHLEQLVVHKDAGKNIMCFILFLEINDLNANLNSAKLDIVKLKEQTKSLQQNVEDLVIRSNHVVPAETRLLNELQHTQRERAIVSSQIEHSMAPSDSNGSLANKPTAGLTVASNLHSFNLQILETIVDHDHV